MSEWLAAMYSFRDQSIRSKFLDCLWCFNCFTLGSMRPVFIWKYHHGLICNPKNIYLKKCCKVNCLNHLKSRNMFHSTGFNKSFILLDCKDKVTHFFKWESFTHHRCFLLLKWLRWVMNSPLVNTCELSCISLKRLIRSAYLAISWWHRTNYFEKCFCWAKIARMVVAYWITRSNYQGCWF